MSGKRWAIDTVFPCQARSISKHHPPHRCARPPAAFAGRLHPPTPPPARIADLPQAHGAPPLEDKRRQEGAVLFEHLHAFAQYGQVRLIHAINTPGKIHQSAHAVDHIIHGLFRISHSAAIFLRAKIGRCNPHFQRGAGQGKTVDIHMLKFIPPPPLTITPSCTATTYIKG